VDGDRERWNAKWRERAGGLEPPNPFVEEMLARLPATGRALDVAGGAGRHAVLLARRGLRVTMVDASDVALAQAERRAEQLGVGARMRYLRQDLDEPLLLAPTFDVVVIVDYLNRARRDELARLLHENGYLLAIQPTQKNLERHTSPSERHLVEPGELAAWARELGFELVETREGWTHGGRHAAELLARRRAETAPPPREPTESHGPYR
jgi:SAM-dependent methyltransferase